MNYYFLINDSIWEAALEIYLSTSYKNTHGVGELYVVWEVNKCIFLIKMKGNHVMHR